MHLHCFGDSFTFGHGLEDCILEGNAPGRYPSKFAWPAKLADLLGYKHQNFGVPGNTNYNIWFQIQNSLGYIKKEDTVVILWTFPSRYSFLTSNCYPAVLSDRGINVAYFSSFLNLPPFENKPVVEKTGDKYYKMFHAHLTSSFNDRLNTLIKLDHINTQLQKIGCKVLNASIDKIESTQTRKFIKPNIEIIWTYDVKESGKALDDNHPCEAAHSEFASLVYNKLKEK